MAASSIHCIFTVSRDHAKKVMKFRNDHPQIFTAYLRCSVTTSESAEKYLNPLSPKVRKAEGASKRLASSILSIFTGCRGPIDEGQKIKKKGFKLKSVSENCFGASGSPEGAPLRAASPIHCILTMPRAQARSTAYLQVGAPNAPSHPVNMQSICSADGRGLEESKTERFPFPEGSWAARRGPRKKF